MSYGGSGGEVGVLFVLVLARDRALREQLHVGDEPGAPTLRQLAAPGVTLLIYMNNLPLAELATELRAGYGRSVPIALQSMTWARTSLSPRALTSESMAVMNTAVSRGSA